MEGDGREMVPREMVPGYLVAPKEPPSACSQIRRAPLLRIGFDTLRLPGDSGALQGGVMNTMEVGTKLVELCKKGENMQAIEILYSPSIVSVEALSMPNMPAL